MNPAIISVAVGGVVLVTALLAANEYRKELKRPTRISENWFASADTRWRNQEYPELRNSKYQFSESDRSVRTRTRNQLDDRNDYEAIVHRPSRGWSGGRYKRKTMKK